jgi:threonyl-tRNA synthetase
MISNSSSQNMGLQKMRHSAAHLMAAAVSKLWTEAKFGVGPAIKNGFYYDIDLPNPLTPKDLEKIEKKMRELKNRNLPYERIDLTIDEAISEMEKRGQVYKVDLLKLLKEKGSTAVIKETGDDDAVSTEDEESGVTSVSFYSLGEFMDLCKGPHLNSTDDIGVFKLTNIAGAYWRGNEKNKQLQRVYGVVFETKEDLELYLWQQWIAAMEIIQDAMQESGYPYVEIEGEAAFYGPKIDFMISSIVGTEYAISTNQLDFLASERFNLVYKGEDDKEHYVYVIHRAPLGSHERFIAFLIEHYAGVFPVWLAPIQVIIIPISDRHLIYAQQIYHQLFNAEIPTASCGIRVELDDSSERMQKKIRNAQLRKIPYMLIVGDEEEQDGTVSIRLRNGKTLQALSIERLIDRIDREVKTRKDDKEM